MSKNQTTNSRYTFREIQHTADLGLEVWGACLKDLFKNALTGLYYLICKKPEFIDSRILSIDLQDHTLEDLFVSFLNQCNYFAQVRGEFCTKVIRLKILKNKQYYQLRFEGIYSGLKQNSLSNMTEIKAATYHQLRIEKYGASYHTKIIFDS